MRLFFSSKYMLDSARMGSFMSGFSSFSICTSTSLASLMMSSFGVTLYPAMLLFLLSILIYLFLFCSAALFGFLVLRYYLAPLELHYLHDELLGLLPRRACHLLQGGRSLESVFFEGQLLLG